MIDLEHGSNSDAMVLQNSSRRSIKSDRKYDYIYEATDSALSIVKPRYASHFQMSVWVLIKNKPMLTFLCFQGFLISTSFLLTTALFALEGYSGMKEKDVRVGLGSLLLMLQVVLIVQVSVLSYHVLFLCRKSSIKVPTEDDRVSLRSDDKSAVQVTASPILGASMSNDNVVGGSSYGILYDKESNTKDCCVASDSNLNPNSHRCNKDFGSEFQPKETNPSSNLISGRTVETQTSEVLSLFMEEGAPLQFTQHLLKILKELPDIVNDKSDDNVETVSQQLKIIKEILAANIDLPMLRRYLIFEKSDMRTMDYLQNVGQIPISNHRSNAQKNWKKIKLNMSKVSNSLRAPHILSIDDIIDKESSDDEVVLPVRYASFSGSDNTENQFDNLNQTVRRRQAIVNKRIERSAYYKDPHMVPLQDLRDMLYREGIRKTPLSNKVAMLPGLQKENMMNVYKLLTNQKFLKWDFNVFKLEEFSEGHSLWFAGMMIFTHYNFAGAFNISMEKLSAFLLYIEQTYCHNPKKPNVYHTHLHAADVLLTVGHFCEAYLVTSQLQGIHAFSLTLAAIMHDYRHPGVNNNYLVSKLDEMSLVYNDISVLENYHASESFRVLLDPQFNILENWQNDDIRAFRSTFIKCILATDLACSTEYTSKFENSVSVSKVFDTPKNQTLLCQVILKVADVSHPSKPWEIHRRWSNLIEEEFFIQGDKEREQGLPVSPLCDRALQEIKSIFISFPIPCTNEILDSYVGPTEESV